MRVLFAYTCVAALVLAACGGRATSPLAGDIVVDSNDSDSAPAEPGEAEPATPAADGPLDSDQIEEDERQGEDEPAENAEPELAIDRVRASLERFCGECHGAAARASGNVMGNIGYIDDLERLVDEGWLVPLGADESPLILSMQNGSMPPRLSRPRPTRDDIQEIIDFVEFTGFWMASDNLGLR